MEIELRVPSNPLPWKYIVLHHSLTKDRRTPDWGGIKRFHTSYRVGGHIITPEQAHALMAEGKKVTKPWRDIGYHFGIENVGEDIRVQYGRSLATVGAHSYIDPSHSIFPPFTR